MINPHYESGNLNIFANETKMITNTSKVTIHMVSSLDGIIAKKDNSVSWFETKDKYENGIEEENGEEFMITIDCFVMGSRTYEHAFKTF